MRKPGHGISECRGSLKKIILYKCYGSDRGQAKYGSLISAMQQYYANTFIKLSFNGGGGVEFTPPPPIFICENNRKSNKIMHCVDFFIGSFEDMGIFHVF